MANFATQTLAQLGSDAYCATVKAYHHQRFTPQEEEGEQGSH